MPAEPSPDTSRVIEGLSDFSRNFIHFIDIYDAPLRTLYVVVSGLKKFKDNVFNIFAHVTGLREGRGIRHGEGYVQNARERLGKQGFAATCWAYEKNI